MVVELYVNHTFNISQEMASIQSHVTTSGLADDAVKLLYGLVNSGYASTYQQPAETALVAMINDHQITATQAANDLLGFRYRQRQPRIRAVDGDRDLQRTRCCECGVGGGGPLRAIHKAHPDCRACASSMVGGSNSVPDNPALDALVFQQINLLVSTGVMTRRRGDRRAR